MSTIVICLTVVALGVMSYMAMTMYLRLKYQATEELNKFKVLLNDLDKELAAYRKFSEVELKQLKERAGRVEMKLGTKGFS